MLKPDDPAWTELVAEIESVVSLRYVEDPDAPWGPSYTPSEEEPGFSFESLNRRDRQSVLADMVSWRSYESQGMSYAEARLVIANVVDGKPQEKWLEGVFDRAVVESEKIAGFKASMEDREKSSDNHVFEETNGDHLPWAELSAGAKLQYIAMDAARNDVPFEPFAQVVKETIGDFGQAAIQILLEGQKKLHAIAKLFPDDERTEPTPLVNQVKEMVEYVSALETQELELRENAGQKDRGKPENLPSGPVTVTTDHERKLAWMETIRRLDAAYTAAGMDALAKMNGIEIHVLYAEKKAELDAVQQCIAEHGADDISQMHKQKLQRQTADMAAWMRVHCPDFRDMEQRARKASLAEFKETVTLKTAQPEDRNSQQRDKEGKLSLRDLRHGSQEQEKRGEDHRSKLREVER